MRKIKYLFLVFIGLHLYSCSEDTLNNITGEANEEPTPDEPNTNEDAEVVYTSNRAGQDPLNIIYFVPSDVAVPADSILVNYGKSVMFAQRWYEKMMELNGYGSKTFALYTNQDNTEAKVLVVNGTKTAAEYDGNIGNYRAEIDDFMANNPDEIGGLDAIVATDEDLKFNVAQIGDWDTGRYGCIRSNDDWDLRDSGKDLDGLDLLVAGRITAIMHEGAHVFGSPHFAHKASDLPNMDIMGGGGGAKFYESGNEDKLFLMSASAAFCNVNRNFNPADNGIDYLQEPTVSMIAYIVAKNDSIEATEFDVTFTSDMQPVYIYAGFVGQDGTTYGTVPFGTQTITATGNPNEYTAHFEAPYADYYNGFQTDTKSQSRFEINVVVNNSHRATILEHGFSISNAPEPDDNINISNESIDITLSDRSTWSITTNTTNQNNLETQAATKMLDGDYDTFWQSSFPYDFDTNGPHTIDVDFGTDMRFDGLYINSNRDNARQFYPKDISVQVSTDGENFTEVLTKTLSDVGEHLIAFDDAVTGRYLKIVVSSINATNGVPNLTVTELDIVNGIEVEAP